MNILLINNLYGSDSVGGAEEVVRARAERFTKGGHSCFVLSSGTRHETHTTRQGDIEALRMRPKNLCWYKELSNHSFVYRLCWHMLNLFDCQTAKKIVAFCQEHQIDRVETHNLIGISMQVPRYLRTAGIVHHHYLHDVQLVEPSGILPADHVRDSLAQRLYSYCIRQLFGSPAVVYSPTRFLKEFYRQRGFFPESEWRVEYESFTRDTRHVTRDTTTPKKYLFVGSLVEHKGVRQLLNAWNPEELVTRYSVPVTLTIVGDGPLRSFVEEASSNDTSIHYLGRLPHDALDAVYASHDVLVFPSQCMENRPNVIAEAMAHGLEIIAVQTGGVAEMVEGYTAVRFIAPTESISL
jgi:glycosyltransferase involved in cell wall biosynthesis